MDTKSSNIESERIEFIADKMFDESGKFFIRIEVPVKDKGFAHNFFVHFRKKGKIQWQSSPLIRNSNFIDMHGLDSNSLYEIRVAVLSAPKDVTTDEDKVKNKDIVIEEINDSDKEKYLPNNCLQTQVIERFAIDLIEQIIEDALIIVNTTTSEQNLSK